MNEKQIKLIIGSLLHDIGKIVCQSGDGRNPGAAGADYLIREAEITDPEILNCVRFDRGAVPEQADMPADSIAYLVSFADQVAAAAGGKESGAESDKEQTFDKRVPLESIFNILNGNHGNLHYDHMILNPEKGINYPTDRASENCESFYQEVSRKLTETLKDLTYSDDYVNSLLTALEENTSYIPSSTVKKEFADISLYDHAKMTAALASCLEQALAEQGITDYHSVFATNKDMIFKEPWFLLYSMDVSGIQKFIYSVGTSGVLKGLRARSFYLEFLLEHIIDELLSSLSLSRANLIYTGGGHCYFLLPNTEKAKEATASWQKKVNDWLMDRFGTALYVAAGSTECSAQALCNEPKGAYSELFREMSRNISAQKARRYTASELIRLNHFNERGERECKICRRMEPLNEEDKCEICAVLEKTSADILYQDYFVVLHEKQKDALPLPGDCCMVAASREKLINLMERPSYVRSYTKNQMYTGLHTTTKLWVGSYTTGKTFEEFANEAEGIERLAVLRADVDNLGTAFVSGFDDRYLSLSRTASFSRQLSLFFKGYINRILNNGASAVFSEPGSRNAAIVYSGGDDLFLVGSWNEVIDAFIDIRNELMKFTEGTLTISGGIGLYPGKHPINLMAAETEVLEKASKDLPDKNAVTLFDETGAYPWPVFIEDVIGQKYMALQEFFDTSSERGMAFLYRLLDLLRNSEEKIQFARYIYLLSRLEPDADDNPGAAAAYRKFSEKMVRWYQSESDKAALITATYLYVYRVRGREKE